MLSIFFLLKSCSLTALNLNQSDINNLEGNLEKSVVNIIVPPDGLGGFGDLTSNLYMGEKLLEEGFKVNIFIDPSFEDKFKILEIVKDVSFDDFFLGESNSIFYYKIPSKNSMVGSKSFNQAIPRSSSCTIYASFSSMYYNNEYHVKRDSIEHSVNIFMRDDHENNIFLFGEYIGVEKFLSRQLKGSNLQPYTNWNKGKKIIFLATGPLTYGIYISPVKPLIENKKINLINEFFNNNFDLSKEHKLGFCYTKGAGSTNVYLAGVSAFAKKNLQSSFFIISKFPPHKDLKIPDNVKIAVVPKLSFTKTKEIIASSDFPLMITGDMSLSLALDLEKEFFYEALGHKFPIEQDIRVFKGLSDFPVISIFAENSNFNIQAYCDDGDVIELNNADASFIEKSRANEFIKIIEDGLDFFLANPYKISEAIGLIRPIISLPTNFKRIVCFNSSEIELSNLLILKQNSENWQNSVNIWMEKLKNDFYATSEKREFLEKLEKQNINFVITWKDINDEKTYIEAKKNYENAFEEGYAWGSEEEYLLDKSLSSANIEIELPIQD